MTTYTVTTWGRWGDHDPLGIIRVRHDGISTRAECAARSIARRLGLHVITLRQDGLRPGIEAHYQTTLGRSCPGGGWIPRAEVWFAVPMPERS